MTDNGIDYWHVNKDLKGNRKEILCFLKVFFLSIRDILLDNQKFEIAYLFSWFIFLISMIADFITTQISFQIKGLSERNQF
jgi:hypothetical protein